MTRSASGFVTAGSALSMIGGTPLIRLGRVAPEGHAVLAKAEFANPGGSVKDRPALAMIQRAVEDGTLTDGATIVEATSGNTGISLAMIAAVLGYHCILVMPEDMSLERRQILKTYGAEVVLTPPHDGMAGAVKRAHAIASGIDNSFVPEQFSNPANPDAHAEGTAREILEQTGGDVGVFVAGVGTGGTLSGVGRVLKQELGNQVRIVAVEPAASAVLSGRAPGLHAIQGLGAGFVPDVLDKTLIDGVVAVKDVTAERMAGQLAREEGLLVGPSSGANVAAACQIAQDAKGPVVTVLPDSGERYLF